MNKKIFFAFALTALLVIAGCSKPAANTNTNANTAKPSPSATPKPAGDTAKKPETKLPTDKAAPVPADWIPLADESKGYEFKVPAGTEGKVEKTPDGVDVYSAKVPAPYEIGIMVFAFKDKTKTKDDLMAGAKAALESMGEKDVKFEALAEITADYSIAKFTSVDASGKKTAGNILVATDVTDNYIMIVGCDDAKFAANEKTIDAIWGSFAMYSSGASGTN
ncbi:MAG: hypothetical protein ABIP75_17390 [Pyrinomonadaceae bacterium]